jgi:predicted CxxxxCH...CXXCH cytochrome family protein
MRKKINLIIAVLLIVGIQFFVNILQSDALDNPHVPNNSVNCSTCHDPSGPAAGTWWSNQGQAGGLCGQCHNPTGIAQDVVTHSSAAIGSAKYGTWGIQCSECHNPHSQSQNRTYKAASYLTTGVITAVTSTALATNSTFTADYTGMMLLPDVRYPTLTHRIASTSANTIYIDKALNGLDEINLTYIRPGARFAIVYGNLVRDVISGRTVRFFSDTGPNSFADDDGTTDGVCQVCHETTVSFNRDGMLEGPAHPVYQAGKPCANCHQHQSAFRPVCMDCHGYAPVANTLGGPDGLVNNDGGTGSATAGAHQKHTVGMKYTCESCHTGGMLDSPVYDKNIQIGFVVRGIAGGSYDGRTVLVNGYTYSAGNAETTLTQNNGMSCTSIYCHSTGQSDSGGPLTAGDYAAPQWAVPASGQCGTCHNAAAGSTPPASGSHQKHAGATAMGNYAFSCTTCHAGFSETGPDHVDGKVNVTIDPQFGNSAVSAADGQNVQRGFAGSTCSSTYCHSNGTSVSSGIIPANTSTTWGSGTLSCNSCHGYPPNYASGSPKANSHPAHISKSCDNCHVATTSDGITITNSANHVNVQYNLSPGSGRNFSYTFDAQGGTCGTISCHSNTGTVWGASACMDCHSVAQGNRAAVTQHFNGNSHHIQGIAVTNAKCYHCHWEANADGTINTSYHGGSSAPGSVVNLVVYGAGARPTSYSAGVTAVQYTADGTRTEIAKITTHCIGCHSDQNNSTQPFGDGKTPNQYAWDGTSVNARYSQAGLTNWGKYTGFANAAKKIADKAYSAHGNAAANQRGWSTTTGVDGSITNTSGAVDVECFDCHNSHGSTVSGITTRYTSATVNGGILKDTITSQGGYAVTYQPVSGGTVIDKNVRNPGASLCLDCHLSATTGTTPWGYTTTFGAAQAIIGYWDSPYLAPGGAGPQIRFPYKNLSQNAGGHFGASAPLSSTPMQTINGLCTPCHDPHGVSPSLGLNQQYAVPLLKGTWVTSPYKEDVAPANNAPATVRDSTYPLGTDGAAREGVQYHIDQNTFGANIHASVTGTGIAQTDSQFAGLCLTCHTKGSLTDGADGGTWKSIDRIHESVKGWGANVKHNYTCSKCHSPHNGSALPRLMVTNCLDKKHKGRMGLNPAPVTAGSGSCDDYNCYGLARTIGFGWWFPNESFIFGNGGGSFPGAWGGSYPNTYLGSYSVSCHEGKAADQGWNQKTGW